jgi:hypothetical protein
MLAVSAATLLVTAAATSPPVSTADPDGGAAWTARLTQSGTRTECTVVRRGATPKGRFCAVLTATAPFQYAVRYETPPDTTQWRTVFAISFAPAVSSATLQTPDGMKRYRRGAGPRLLLVVARGRVEQGELRAMVRVRGRTYTGTAGRARTAEVPDPLGEAGWRTAPDPPREGAKRRCVSWEREPPRFGEEAPPRQQGRERCGSTSRAVQVRAVELVDGRVVVFGLVGRRVSAVALRSGEQPLDVAFDRRSRSYLAVLPGEVDPASLTLRVTAAGQTTVIPADEA